MAGDGSEIASVQDQSAGRRNCESCKWMQPTHSEGRRELELEIAQLRMTAQQEAETVRSDGRADAMRIREDPDRDPIGQIIWNE